jgi:UDP-GlcNAc:undecaprenyl-phosphate GlcNAc-1-phosphate transferase
VNPWWGALIGLAVAVAATPMAIRIARKVGLLDRPGSLKTHAEAVPYLGGTAVFAGLAVVAIATGHPLLLVPPALALGLGLVDDVRPLPVSARLVVEVGIGVAAGLVAGARSPWEIVLATLITVVAINAVNFTDGVDGLAAGVCGCGGAGVAFALGDTWATIAAGTAGAVVGFGFYNRPPARIYLGDAGSYLLGATLAMFAVHVVVESHHTVPALGIAAIGAYPLIEFASTIARRGLRRTSLFTGDLDHIYNRLGRLGWSRGAVSGALTVAHGLVVIAGVVAVRERSAGASIAVLAVILVLALAGTAPAP